MALEQNEIKVDEFKYLGYALRRSNGKHIKEDL